MRLLTVLLVLSYTLCSAQEYSISGTAVDSTERTPLIGVSVLLLMKDTVHRDITATDINGKFGFSNIKPGQYKLRISYLGYNSRVVTVDVKSASVDTGPLWLGQSISTLKTVEVTGTAIQVEQKGDTTQYNASAFKTSRDASVEDLMNKMPGIISDGTGLKVQGEAVQQVLVDGKQFFGDDAAIALKNLPAEIVEKIEVFDRLSEQAQFTGFDDGQTRRTVNIVTKRGRNNGQFGRVYAGAGENSRYTSGGNINSFNGNRRLSLVGLSNNINQQNFGNEDLLGINSASNSGGGGGRGGNSGRGGGGASNNFSVGQQSGIATTHSIGLNYSDEWGKHTEVSGSYFFNMSDNERIADLNRLYITQSDSGLVYKEMNRATSDNYNHRLNFRIEHELDSANTIIITPRLSFQKNDSRSVLNGNYAGAESGFDRLIDNQNKSGNSGYSFANSLVFRHRFAKRGRSFSVSVNTDVNNRDGSTSLNSHDEDQTNGELRVVDQRSSNFTDSYNISTNLSYTEPLGKFSQFQMNYTPSYRKSKTDKKTYDFNEEAEGYSELDTLLTNSFDNEYFTHRGGMSYRFNNRKISFNPELNYQYARLTSDQVFPYAFAVDRSFNNLLPQLVANFRFSQTENLRFNYRTTTNAPSVNQLQNVVDNRNPLFLRTGNPDLSQDFNHSLTLRYNKTNPTTSTSFLVMLSGGIVQNYITNTSVIASRDTTVNDIELRRGTQLSFPVNTEGRRNANTLVTYGFPVKHLKTNFNLNTGFNYSRTPALINGSRNLANNYAISQGAVVSSNISEDLDFTLSYNSNYTIVRNTLRKQSDNNYWNQTMNFRFNWVFLKGFVLNSNLNYTAYRGLSAEFDQSYWFWNASFGYKFLKDRSLELKITAFDILNENNNITRDITETYIEDRRTNVLTQYYMVILTYKISRFKQGQGEPSAIPQRRFERNPRD